MRTLISLLFCLVSFSSLADGVKLQLGEHYQIRCQLYPTGCVAPSASNEKALTYLHGSADNSWWTITKDLDGFFIIQNVQTKRYMTYDGFRTADRRYVYLSTTDHGSASRWKIYPGRTGILICRKNNMNHLLDVRRNSFIVGTYNNASSVATDNERFFLVDRKGRIVTDVEGEVKLPENCFDNKTAKAGATLMALRQMRIPGRLNFTIDGRQPVYDARSGTYFFTLPQRTGNEFTGRLASDNREGQRFFVDGTPARSGNRGRFVAPENGRVYRVALASDEDTVAVARVTFTYLPIVELGGSNFSKSRFSGGTFRLHDPDGLTPDSTFAARLRYRGDYATFMEKKSFAVKLTDQEGHSIDRSLLGMRSDNYWILDAMAVDHARMRNRVAMELWDDIATAPYYAAGRSHVNSVRGRLVEVFLNGRYHGVYNLTERMDRKQMNLAKSAGRKAKGCLYKTRQWGEWTLLGIDRNSGKPLGYRPPQYDNRSSSWANWEAKYPKSGSDQQTEWKPLYEALSLCATADNRTFANEVGERFDLPVVRDYYLFIELLHAVDNSGKNMYWAVGDATQSQRLTPAPWDLDGTFGRNWDGHRSNCNPENDYHAFLLRHRMQNALFERLARQDVDNWKSQLANRYRALRCTHFAPDRLMARFHEKFRLLERSGAATRERHRWNNTNGIYLNFQSEEEYLNNWIKRRIAYLDSQYNL